MCVLLIALYIRQCSKFSDFQYDNFAKIKTDNMLTISRVFTNFMNIFFAVISNPPLPPSSRIVNINVTINVLLPANRSSRQMASVEVHRRRRDVSSAAAAVRRHRSGGRQALVNPPHVPVTGVCDFKRQRNVYYCRRLVV